MHKVIRAMVVIEGDNSMNHHLFVGCTERLDVAPGGRDHLVARVNELAAAVAAGDGQGAHLHLADKLQHTRAGSTFVQRLIYIFTESLLARLAGDPSGNGNLP